MGDAAQPDTCATLAPCLSGLLDSELTLPERVAVEQHLRVCQNCARSLERARAARLALRNLNDGLDVPIRLQERRRTGLALAVWWRRQKSRVAMGGIAAVMALAAVVSALWFMPRGDRPALADRAVAAYQSANATDTPLLPATDNAEDAAQWASAVMGHTVEVPDLDEAGYHLLGVRSEPALGKHAVALVYHGQDEPLTCFMLPGHLTLTGPAHGSTKIRLADLRGTRVAGWWEDDATYLLVGAVPPDALLPVAELASQQ